MSVASVVPPPPPAVVAAVRGCRRALASAAVLSGFINILMLTGSFYMLQVYDRVMTSHSIPTLVAITVLAGVLFAFMGLFELLRTRIITRIGARIDEQLRTRAFDAVVKHALKRTANVGTQPVRDLDAVRQFVSGPGLHAFFDLPWAPIYLAVCFLFHPVVGYYTLAGAMILFGLALLNEVVTRKSLGDAVGASLRAQGMTEEARRSAEVLGAMGMLAPYRARWASEFGRSQRLSMAAGDGASVIAASSKSLRMFLQSAILGVGAALAIKGEITVGVMIACSILMARAVAPVDQIIAQWRGLIMARKAYERLKVMLGSADEAPEPMRLPPPTGRLSVEPLTVLAPGTERALLKDIELHLEPGDGLGIIGPTGSGKSTLARVLVGIWPPAKGCVRLDGASLEQWHPGQLGCAIGYLPQDVEILSGTVQENIARFDPDPDPEKVVRAARFAHAHDMILRFPEGYQTELGEGGAKLSAGQRQRIGLARALYGDPVLLVLDEPNSNLDTAGEAALTAAIEEARARGATVIVIAHRPSALKPVDKLLYMNGGQIVAFGPKHEVLARLSRPIQPPPGTAPPPGGPTVAAPAASAKPNVVALASRAGTPAGGEPMLTGPGTEVAP
jgi:ATP-binding cassette subfamily C protein